MKQKLHIRIKNDLSELERIRKLVNQFFDTNQLPTSVTYTIDLALEELITNIILFAYNDDKLHKIDITLERLVRKVTLSIEDDGKAFNPLTIKDPILDTPIEERPIGGLGLYLIKNFVDDIQYYRQGNKNYLVITKKIN